MPWRITLYLSKTFLKWFFIAFMLFVFLIFLIELLEITRRSAGHNISGYLLLKLALYKTPAMADIFLPFISFMGTLLASWRLQKSSELVSMSTLGLSGHRIFIPFACLTLFIGSLNLTLLNPISATLQDRYESLNQRFFRHSSDTFSLHNTGFWLRQKQADGNLLMHAEKLQMDTRELRNITVYFYNPSGAYRGRMDAHKAILNDQKTRLINGWTTMVDAPPIKFQTKELSIDLTFSQIRRSLKPPQTLSFWRIQEFISLMDKAGISAREHQTHWHKLLASPFWLMTMSLLALATMLSLPQRNQLLKRVGVGLFIGFFLYFLKDLSQGISNAGNLPVFLGIWGPMTLSLSIGIALLLHIEGH